MSSWCSDCPLAGLEAWVPRADQPKLPIVQCSNLPRKARSKLEVTWKGVGMGVCSCDFSLLLPFASVSLRDHIPLRSQWGCWTEDGQSSLPEIAGLKLRKGGPSSCHDTDSRPENSVKLCQHKVTYKWRHLTNAFLAFNFTSTAFKRHSLIPFLWHTSLTLLFAKT